jgi:hypothetical protein
MLNYQRTDMILRQVTLIEVVKKHDHDDDNGDRNEDSAAFIWFCRRSFQDNFFLRRFKNSKEEYYVCDILGAARYSFFYSIDALANYFIFLNLLVMIVVMMKQSC